MFVRPSSFHHTDRGTNKNSGVCTAKLVNTVELQMAKRHTTKHPGLEQQEELGREVIVADLELTEVHEEATEGHPGKGERDRIVVGDAPGGRAQDTHVFAHSPFPEMAATSCGMPVDV